jgi:hypothetical protein
MALQTVLFVEVSLHDVDQHLRIHVVALVQIIYLLSCRDRAQTGGTPGNSEDKDLEFMFY